MLGRLSTGFLLASLLQAAVFWSGSALGLIDLRVNPTLLQFLNHLLIGQFAGFIFWFLLREVYGLAHFSTEVLGAAYGVILWPVVLGIASLQGLIAAPWYGGIAASITTLLAFITYGIVAGVTVRREGQIPID